MDKIKIFGERNSGTNYLSELIKVNFDVSLYPGVVPKRKILKFSEATKNLYFFLTYNKNLGWKHSYVDVSKILTIKNYSEIAFITITKNPYSFLLSLYKRPYHYIGNKPKSFQEFLETKWYVQGRENYIDKYFKNPIDLWNQKNRAYIEMKHKLPSQTYCMAFESLLMDYEKELKNLNSFFGFKLKENTFKNYNNSTKDADKSHSYYQDYYLNENWLKELNKENVEFINTYLDETTMNYFSYNKIELIK